MNNKKEGRKEGRTKGFGRKGRKGKKGQDR